MFARLVATSLLLLQAMVVLAEPIPAPAPTAPPVARRDIFGDIGSAVASEFSAVASDGSSIANQVYTWATSVGDVPITFISDQGGNVYTLARNGVGEVTSIGGHEYTIATDGYAQFTSDVASAYSSATHTNAASISRTPMTFTLTYSLIATLVGVMMGAAFVF